MDCLKCKYFYVTWDRRLPRGCKLYNLKGVKLPSEYVKEATGIDCPKFEKKEGLR